MDKSRTASLLHDRGMPFPALVNRFLHQGIPWDFFLKFPLCLFRVRAERCQGQALRALRGLDTAQP